MEVSIAAYHLRRIILQMEAHLPALLPVERLVMLVGQPPKLVLKAATIQI